MLPPLRARKSAQVFGVLLLALAIDVHFPDPTVAGTGVSYWQVFFSMIVLAVGECCALKNLVSERPELAEMISGAITAGFVAITIRPDRPKGAVATAPRTLGVDAVSR